MNRRSLLKALAGIATAAALPIHYVADVARGTARWVNVRWFGALGDDLADDTAAFQRAIDSAGDGGIVFVPSGSYRVDLSKLKFTARLSGTADAKPPQLV